MNEKQNKLLVSRGLDTSYERDAYLAGFDCAINGASAHNCHMDHFMTSMSIAAWEMGKRDGEAERELAKEIQNNAAPVAITRFLKGD
ncbi:MAG: hypothetical protein KAS32_05565 [Candidatus Peribacteraceae bacterium]|nr:hypothetical protein [Candidatus Peribacteraceae bacterium]